MHATRPVGFTIKLVDFLWNSASSCLCGTTNGHKGPDTGTDECAALDVGVKWTAMISRLEHVVSCVLKRLLDKTHSSFDLKVPF